VEEEVGGAFIGFPGGADEADSSDGGGATVWIGAIVAQEVADAKHAVSFDGFFEHLTVAGLEDMERHPSVREEDGVGQEDDAAGFGNGEGVHFLVRGF
jgi:hypothetical protein|tara:strand:- start:429 stop:722 length:294 start_codon:yes stop_codon:yes gene_type:complete